MTAIVLPDVDRSTIEELKKRIPDLSEIELSLPSRKEVSRTAKEVSRAADDTIDRLLGRKRPSAWPWIAAGIGLVAVIGAVAAWFAWFRRPTWESQSEPWTQTTYETEETLETVPPMPMSDDTRSSVGSTTSSRSAAGQSTTETAGSAPYPIEEA